jgi:uncharacterized coiled-coil DUF342 family protein
MNDQIFVNEYIKILNETLNDAFSKNLVMQAQLTVAKQQSDRTAELESKIRELSNVSTDNNAFKHQIQSLTSQLENVNNQLSNRTSNIDTFKRELVEARNALKNTKEAHEQEKAALIAEIELLKQNNTKFFSKKKKKVLDDVVENNNLISISDTF